MEKDEKPSIGQRLGDYPRYGSPLLSTLWLIIRTLSGLALLVIVGTIAYTIERFDRTGDLPPVLVIEGISMVSDSILTPFAPTDQRRRRPLVLYTPS